LEDRTLHGKGHPQNRHLPEARELRNRVGADVMNSKGETRAVASDSSGETFEAGLFDARLLVKDSTSPLEGFLAASAGRVVDQAGAE